MLYTQPNNWALFQILCNVLGSGQGQCKTPGSVAAGMLPQLVEVAQWHDVLPALAVRCGEKALPTETLDAAASERLQQSLRDNTVRNMQIIAQALKLTRSLNAEGITPLLLKGTAQLLTANTGNIGFRKQADIDLFLEHAHLETAAAVLLGDGYKFTQFSRTPVGTKPLLDTASALKRSANHHHLPGLLKEGGVAVVELHRHYLPGRFQRKNPLEPLLGTAALHESHGARFLVPSAEYQMIHLVLGKLVHDGHLARRNFPLREACDYLHILEAAGGRIDFDLVAQHCGSDMELFSRLVGELMALESTATGRSDITDKRVARYIREMQGRYSSNAMRSFLDIYARSRHLALSLVHSPAKLPRYLGRAH